MLHAHLGSHVLEFPEHQLLHCASHVAPPPPNRVNCVIRCERYVLLQVVLVRAQKRATAARSPALRASHRIQHLAAQGHSWMSRWMKQQ